MKVMTAKEFLQLFRDSVLLIFIVYAFTADIYLAGSGVSLQLKNASLYVSDNDKTEMSREYLSRYLEPEFRFMGEFKRPSQGMDLLDNGKAMLTLDIPPLFQRSVQKGDSVSVQMHIDTTNSVLGFLASNYSSQITGRFSFETAIEKGATSGQHKDNIPVIKDRHRVWFNPNQNDIWFMSISELFTIVTLFSVLLPAAAMVREKEKGTIEQLLVSPLSSFQIMFPKVIAMTAVILAGVSVTLIFILKGCFAIPLKGNIPLFFLVTAIYIFTTAGIGLFISTIAKNLAQVGMMTVLVFIPMLFLSGAWTPPEAMPGWMKIFMFASPLHYYIDSGFGILLKGAGVSILWDEIVAMISFGGFIFSLGMWRFKRQFE